MAFFDDIKAKADVNGDGKLSTDDINHLREQYPDQANYLDELQASADTNGDGKVDLSEAKGLAEDLMANVKNMFGQK